MEGPRFVRPDEYQETIDLINSIFRPDSTCAMEQEYTMILGRSNMENMRVIVEDGCVVSHAAIYPVNILLDGLKLRMGGVGSVATHPQYRSRGHATAILSDCHELQRKHGCDFSVLWTAIPDFYRRLGYEKAGSEMLFHLKATKLKGIPSPEDVVEYSEEHLDAVMDIHDRCPLRVVRSREECEQYFRLPRTTTMLTRSRGEVTAYLTVGKGEDLVNCVHEWGGPIDDLLSLLRHAIEWSGRGALSVLSPEGFPLAETLVKMRVPFVHKEVGMVKIVNIPALFTKLSRFYRSRIQHQLAIDSENGKYRVRAGDETLALESERQLVQVVFGSADRSEVLPSMSEGSIFREVFPLRFFIWGLDTV